MALNEQQQDILKRNFKRLDAMVKGFESGMGLPAQGLSPQELAQANAWATQQAEQAVQLAKAGRLQQRTPRPARKAVEPLPSVVPPGTPEFAVEGGLVNPRSNPALREALRKRGL